MEEKHKDIELRSEEVQEVMGKIPPMIVRWGTTVLFAVLLGLLTGSYFFTYPDVVSTEMTLTGRFPVGEVMARTSGRVSEWYVHDRQEVRAGTPLAVMENTARSEDVFRLKERVMGHLHEPERLSYVLLQDFWLLGEVQPAYQALVSADIGAREYRALVAQLLAAIRQWEMTYCLTAPQDGTVQLLLPESPNQWVQAGESFARIVPAGKTEWVGRAQLPLQRSGKVKVGQRVIVRFHNYPDQEFGTVEGRLSAVSPVPTGEHYPIEITFPKGLTTNYGKQLPLSHEMKATAEIVTDEVRLMEHFFQPLKKILREGLGGE